MTPGVVLVQAVPPPAARGGEDLGEISWALCACPDAATAASVVEALRLRRATLRAARARQEESTRAWLGAHPPIEPSGALTESAHRRAAREDWRTAWAAAQEEAWAAVLGRPLDALDRLALEVLEDGWDVAAEGAAIPWIAGVPAG